MMTLFPDDTEIREILPSPGSATWRYGSDARLYLAMLYPLLLQVAHPTVGAGVRDYSDFEARPWQRLVRSLDWVSLLVYGGNDAVAAGRRLRALHKDFTGTDESGRPYYALEPEAYAWVHATLLLSYVDGHTHFGRPMPPPIRDQFYDEYRRLGRLAGVRDRDLPETWPEFCAYVERTEREVLTRTESVDRVLRAVSHAPPPPVALPDAVARVTEPLWRAASMPAQRATWLGGVGLLPDGLRTSLGIPWTPADERAFDRLGRFARGLTPVMPAPLRVMGPMQLRMRRTAIAHGPLGSRTETTAA